MAVGQRKSDEEEAMGMEERQEAEERAAAERKAREVKAMMTNGRRGAEECATAERKVRDEDAVAMKEQWEVDKRTAVE